ncbi:MAG TPA: GntR family transcriptional regulator [Anaerolineales bacterium]|jgi:GntR family transcriptional regulator
MIHKNVPLALQVLSNINAGIESGDLVRANGQLPSEGELSRLFNVSRSTVREALSRLEQRGNIIRHHGVGTFVSDQTPTLDTGLEQLESINTLARRIGLETQMGEAQIIERPASPQEAEHLQLALGSQVLAVNRLMVTSGRPVAFLVDIIPTTILRASDLKPDFEGSVLDFFLQRADPIPSHALTDIIMEPVNSAILNKLGLGSADTIFTLESLLFSRDGQCMDYSFSYFVPGYFRFHVVRRVSPEVFVSAYK